MRLRGYRWSWEDYVMAGALVVWVVGMAMAMGCAKPQPRVDVLRSDMPEIVGNLEQARLYSKSRRVMLIVQTTDSIKVAVAQNRDAFHVLVDLVGSLGLERIGDADRRPAGGVIYYAPTQPIQVIVWGDELALDDSLDEFEQGIDMRAVAVAWHDPDAARIFVVSVEYGTRVKDMKIDWTALLRRLAQAGWKVAK